MTSIIKLSDAWKSPKLEIIISKKIYKNTLQSTFAMYNLLSITLKQFLKEYPKYGHNL